MRGFSVLGITLFVVNFAQVDNAGEKMAGAGKFLTIFQKQDDGSWKIARDCFNGNGPAE